LGATVMMGLAVLAGAAIGVAIYSILLRNKVLSAKEQAHVIVKAAGAEADTIRKQALLEAKESWYKERTELEKELREQRGALQELERRANQQAERAQQKMELAEHKEREVSRRERKVGDREESVQRMEMEYKNMLKEEITRLEKISNMTEAQARSELMTKILDEVRQDAQGKAKQLEEEIKAEANRKAQEIISSAVQRISSDYVAETTVSVVDLPSDEMKGRIIGREGRNIRALEMATGVDLIIDDTPEAVIISGFDPYRRELTRLALERLIADGRIHPGRIEEVVNKVKKEMEEKIWEDGKQAAFELGIEDLHPEEIKLIGRLQYRYSYSQNMLRHSKEVAYLCGIMAAELGANVKVAKRAGLLHDIGKVVDHQTEGSHTSIGVDLAQKYGESPVIIDAIAAHHGEAEPTCVEAVLLQAADALSAARPGARREMLESYIKRLKKLEEICESFKGVEKSFAIQAGREIRVIAIPEEIRDHQAAFLARDIARRIEKEAAYPGEIKVTVIRETRAVDFAR